MVTCNIVVESSYENKDDLKLISKYENTPSINVITDITHIDTSVPTIFYGYLNAVNHCGEFDRSNKQINQMYAWTYNNKEMSFENWLERFVNDAEVGFFKYIDIGIDLVFEDFGIEGFVSGLSQYPLIHEGTYEIYVADWKRTDNNPIKTTIYSFKKDTLDYKGIEPKDFLNEMYELLDYNFVSIEPSKFDLTNKKRPVFIDNLLFVNCGEWVGIPEIIKHFPLQNIDRKKVIAYYLKRSEYLRPKFILYQ